MRILIVFCFLICEILLAVDGPNTPRKLVSSEASTGGESSDLDGEEAASESDPSRPSTPRGRAARSREGETALEISPATLGELRRMRRLPSQIGYSRPIRYVSTGPSRTRQAALETGSLYLITTRGAEHFAGIPIWDFAGYWLLETEIESFVTEFQRSLTQMGEAFNFYVGITSRGLGSRTAEHRRATQTNPERRLPKELLNSPTAHMHWVARGVPREQLEHLEARLIRALQATGPRGLNGNTGSLDGSEAAAPVNLEVTPSTQTPGRHGVRRMQRLGGRFMVQAEIPDQLQNVLYLVTPEMQVTMPIFDLGSERVSEADLAWLESEIRAYFRDVQFEHYIGQVSAGEHGHRTPLVRAKEHVRASREHPYRRLPFNIRRTNQETGQPAQLHALLANVHPEQIDFLETWLIALFGGLTPLCWNSNPGVSLSTTGYKRKGPRDPDDPDDPDSERRGTVRPLFFGTR